MAIEDKLVGSWANQDRRSLLDLATGGKYKTSSDIPPLSTTGKVTPENLEWMYKRFFPDEQPDFQGGPGWAVEAVSPAGIVKGISSFKNMERTLPALEETLQWLKGYSPSSPLIKKFANLHKKIYSYIHGDARAAKSLRVTKHYKGNKREAEKVLESADKKVADRLNKEYDDIISSVPREGEKKVITGYRTKSLSQEAGKKTSSRSSDDILRKKLKDERRTELEMKRMGSRRKY